MTWKELKEKAKDVVNIDTARQIKQLKELLKRARGLMNFTKYWACSDAREEMIAKIDQVLGEE